MILVDFSSNLHRSIFSSLKSLGLDKQKQVKTEDFIGLMKHYIFEELFSVHQEFGRVYGDIVICLDNAEGGYWRKDVYKSYKSSRKKGREESAINYGEVYEHFNNMKNIIDMYLPWKVVNVPRAEADDLILALARSYQYNEKILIYSPDKDLIQAQRNTQNVVQYSPLTRKYLIPEDKYDDMEHWVAMHVMFGDAADDIPKVIDNTEFSENFIEYLKENNINELTPYEFMHSDLDKELKTKLLSEFNVHKENRKGEQQIKDIYAKKRFGPSTLKKALKEHCSLDKFLDSHPLYRKHYERNFTLTMEEGIPEDIWNKALLSFKTAKSEYNKVEFEKYLDSYNLNNLKLQVPSVFKVGELNTENCGW